LHLPYNT